MQNTPMNKLVKIVGGSLAVLAVGAGIVAGAAVFLSDCKMERIVDVEVTPVDLASRDLARGEYLFVTRGGSATASYSDADWLRLLRHGVKPSGQPAFIMPSEDYAQMADEDVAALVS